MRHGGQLLIDQLRNEGVDTAFCVPGESYLAALDGLYGQNDIRTIVCRQEGGASMMAEAYGKVTGKIASAFVTRGPGATNASVGVHIAQQDSTPMLLFVGQVGLDMQDREAFQEVDFKAMFSPIAKWACEIRQTDRIPEYVARAVHTARSGRPGPVVLALPEDMLSAATEASLSPSAPHVVSTPSQDDMAKVQDALAGAKAPLMVIGGPGWNTTVREQVTTFAERFDLPLTAAFRYQDYMDNRHPNYVGHMGIGIDAALGTAIRDADMLLVMGARLGEMTTSGYTLVKSPEPDQQLIHIHPGAEELGRVFRTDIPVQSTLAAFAQQLEHLTPPKSIAWSTNRKKLREAYEAFSEPKETPGAVKLEQIVKHVSAATPDDAIITNGAGNYAAFVHRYSTYRGYRSQVANTAGSMGYGVPAAVAAKLAEPHRPVISFNGDGCFLMNGQEISTAVRYDLPIIFIVVNNNSYGTIRMHQERDYPSRVSGTDLHNPDFAAYARAFGANGARIEKTEEFADAFEAALQSDKPTLIEVKTDVEAITPTATLSSIRGSGAS